MKICVAQSRPFKGDVLRNIEVHLRLIELAVAANVSHIIFPELSITGYEPGLAVELAMRPDDVRLDVLQTVSDRYAMTIGIGVPTIGAAGILISMLVFQPGQERQVYSKQYLHADEKPFFVGGEEPVFLEDNKIALAICYELSVPAHAEYAHRGGAEIYLVSVAKTKAGMEKAGLTLADIARRYSLTVLISNCVGRCDDLNCDGASAAWNREGELLAQLGETGEGLLILDSETGEVQKRQSIPPIYESQ